MNQRKFDGAELPYGTLAKFGLTQEMVEDLPQSVIEDIMDGKRSPVLPITVADESGNEIHSRTRFAFVDAGGAVDVIFFPQLKVCQLDRFTPDERKTLLDNRAVVAKSVDADGHEFTAFYQIDPGTNQILYVPTAVIGRNLQLIAGELKLTNAELNCLKKGQPVTVMNGEEAYCVGIDLNERCGIRITDGEERKWREERQPEVGKYNFGLNGCWVADAEGNLDYVAEEEYTEEMWEEMKRRNAQPQIKR